MTSHNQCLSPKEKTVEKDSGNEFCLLVSFLHARLTLTSGR